MHPAALPMLDLGSQDPPRNSQGCRASVSPPVKWPLVRGNDGRTSEFPHDADVSVFPILY